MEIYSQIYLWSYIRRAIEDAPYSVFCTLDLCKQIPHRAYIRFETKIADGATKLYQD